MRAILKYLHSGLLVGLILTMAACNSSGINKPYSSTTSSIIVVEKSHAEDYSKQWITAYDPNNQTVNEAFVIMVKELMVWNLIEIDREYFTSYSKSGDEDFELEQIEAIGNDDHSQ